MNCSWHRSENYKKRFFFLNKKGVLEKELYSKIVYMPYGESIDKFEEIYSFIKGNHSLILNEQDLNYLEQYYNKKQLWSKAYILIINALHVEYQLHKE